jgi:hypothetical protein
LSRSEHKAGTGISPLQNDPLSYFRQLRTGLIDIISWGPLFWTGQAEIMESSKCIFKKSNKNFLSSGQLRSNVNYQRDSMLTWFRPRSGLMAKKRWCEFRSAVLPTEDPVDTLRRCSGLPPSSVAHVKVLTRPSTIKWGKDKCQPGSLARGRNHQLTKQR